MNLTPPKNATKVGADAYMWQLKRIEVLEHWEELADILQPAVDVSRGEVSVFSLLHAGAHEQSYIFVGSFQGVARCVVVASLFDFPEHKVCHIDAYAGKATLFYQYLANLEIWARANGCAFMEGHGSESAERLAKRHGFQHSHMVYRKPL